MYMYMYINLPPPPLSFFSHRNCQFTQKLMSLGEPGVAVKPAEIYCGGAQSLYFQAGVERKRPILTRPFATEPPETDRQRLGSRGRRY